jgi:hypothetical protein
MDSATLEIAFAEAKKSYEDALKQQGVAEFNEAEAKEIIEQRPVHEARLAELRDLIKESAQAIDEGKKLLAVLPTADDTTMPCPSCGTQLMYQPSSDLLGSGSLSEGETLSDEQKKERQQAIDEVQNTLTVAEENLLKYQQENSGITHQLIAIAEAEKKLEQIKTLTADSGQLSELENAKKLHESSERRLDNFNRHQKAYQLYEQILSQKELVAALHQNGVRKTKLEERIKQFNGEILTTLSNTMQSENIWLDNDLSLWRGNRPYHLLSRSARYAVRVALQVAIAMADKSELIVIDDMDTLNDRRSRLCMKNLLVSSGIPTLACIARRPDELVPDLEANGEGRTYLVQEGKLTPFLSPSEAQVA